jgi:hypothetical protein
MNCFPVEALAHGVDRYAIYLQNYKLISNIVFPGVDSMCMLKLQMLNDMMTEQIAYIPGGHTARLLLN